jgi:uncharacterized membrane protein YeaQ/YmgE (transglycosylase-associated protein family)
MDKALLDQIVPIVEKTKEGILKGIDFAQQQLPDLIRQIYIWYTCEYIGWLIFSIIGLIAGIFSLRKFYNQTKKPNDFYDGNIGWMILGITGLLIGLFGIPYDIVCLLQINLAPKVFLLNVIKSVMGK